MLYQYSHILKSIRIENTLVLLIFISGALIFLDLGVFSLSFVFGFSLIVYTLTNTPALIKPRGILWLLFAYLVVALFSIIFAELPLSDKQVKIYIQTIYWFLLAVIVFNIYPFLDKRKLSKYILFSVLFLLVLYAVGLRVGTQNGVAFTAIIFAPLGFYYLKKFWLKLAFAGLLIFLMLLNGSRSGAIISLLQSGLILMLTIPRLYRYFKTLLISAVALFAVFFTETALMNIGYFIQPYNNRLGELFIDTEYILRNDISWLQRQAQVQKGKQIFFEHPVLGVGYNNFVRFDIDIDESEIESDRKYIRNIDNRSAHNTYVSLIAETGSLGFSLIITFFILCLVPFWKNSSKIGNTFEAFVFVSFIGLIIYFYTVTGKLGTPTWIIFGLVSGAANKISIILSTVQKITRKPNKYKSFKEFDYK